ncbi:hypothetical protein GBAR_LOCUS8005 [Geodia barretti]|uniref:Uncharacterized protein n=1 Tax=Geodia barretti TaxID=519541 RepID=A0AA35WFD6_GEOBA|nr:hypothetical protein GBAR_LOCUS8005 [Geodia barretti]
MSYAGEESRNSQLAFGDAVINQISDCISYCSNVGGIIIGNLNLTIIGRKLLLKCHNKFYEVQGIGVQIIHK